MIEYKDYYIAFLDILGFSNMIGKENANTIHSTFRRVKQARNIIKHLQSGDMFTEGLGKNTKFFFFSDTIICAIPCSLPHSFEMLTSNCMLIQHALYMAKQPTLLRGAIVRGKMYFEGNEMFGPGLIEAYKLEENLAQYPRIVMTKQTYYDGICESNNGKEIIYIHDTDDSLKMVETLCYFDYPEIETLKNIIGFNLNNEKNPHVREKYLWLKDHFNSFVSQNTHIKAFQTPII